MIYDLDGNNISSTALLVAPGAFKEFAVEIDCVSGFQVSGITDDPDVDIFGKAETGDSYTDIIATPLDLTPYDGQRKTMYFKIEAGSMAARITEIVQLKVALP